MYSDLEGVMVMPRIERGEGSSNELFRVTNVETETSKSPFYQSRERYFFRSYEEVEDLYNVIKQFVSSRDEFLNE